MMGARLYAPFCSFLRCAVALGPLKLDSSRPFLLQQTNPNLPQVAVFGIREPTLAPSRKVPHGPPVALHERFTV
eukprot:1097418-Alexandrium_andersonii.AAC.1